MKPPDIDYTNDQQVFDYVAKHLLTQNTRCTEGDGTGASCAYRSPDGKLACAIGCLLTDEEARRADLGHEEGSPFSIQDILSDISTAATRMERVNKYLLIDLQNIHDCATPDEWKGDLEAVAFHHSLDWRHE